MELFFTALLFVTLYVLFQGIVYLKYGTTPAEEAKKKLATVKNSKTVSRILAEKQVKLKKMGAGVILKDNLTVSQWYLYKGLMALLSGSLVFFVADGILKAAYGKPIAALAAIIGWFVLDIMLKASDSSSNDEMMPDIMEMGRSVLYGKRGGQYIADALRDSVLVVENRRLKTALIQMRNSLDSGMSLNECLDELEMGFSNTDISSFCTVIRSLQLTGQVDDALRALEGNIEREQASISKRRCMVLEQKTMMYVLMIAVDIMAIILYCIIMKLLEMELGF